MRGCPNTFREESPDEDSHGRSGLARTSDQPVKGRLVSTGLGCSPSYNAPNLHVPKAIGSPWHHHANARGCRSLAFLSYPAAPRLFPWFILRAVACHSDHAGDTGVLLSIPSREQDGVRSSGSDDTEWHHCEWSWTHCCEEVLSERGTGNHCRTRWRRLRKDIPSTEGTAGSPITGRAG